jgi:hypothetical protein
MGYNCCMYLQFVAQGFDVPDRMPALPPARDFLLSAGFGGAAALLAALVVAVVAVVLARGAAKRHRAGLEQQERQHREVREEKQRAAAIARCWQRLVWVVDTAGLEPAGESATLGLGPELALEILRGLLRDAEQLGDDTLAGAVMVHLNQFSLVLAQQAGPLADLTATPAAAPTVSGPTPRTSPKAGGSAAGDDASSPTTPAKGSAEAPPRPASTTDSASAGQSQAAAATLDEPAPATAQTATATARGRRRAQ